MRALVILPFLLSISLPGQRGGPTLEWQKRTTTISYGAVPTGQHGLSELKVGDTWRLGMNEASTWQLTMPILVGDTWIAPGQYRINLHRRDEEQCALVANGSNSALGGGDEAQVTGKLTKLGKPAKKLAIDVTKAGAAVAGNQPAQIVVQFGETAWRGEVMLLGNKTVSVPGGKLAVFSVPSARLESGPVPIATLSKGKDGDQGSWNVVFEKSQVRLVPWMTAPLENNGFGAVIPPEAALQTHGTVTLVEANTDKELEVLELREASLTKGELRLVMAFGTRTLECRLPEPKGKSVK